MKVTFDTPITILHVLTFARVLRYGFVMKRKPYQLCDDIIGEIRNMLDAPPAGQPAATETGPKMGRCGVWACEDCADEDFDPRTGEVVK